MAVFVPITTWIGYAKVAQFLASNDKNKNQLFQNGNLNQNLPRLLYIVRNSIQWLYDNNPNDERLNQQGLYLKQLIGPYFQQAIAIEEGDTCTAVFIVAQPQTQSVAEGGTVILSVTVGGTSPFTYQWYKDGSPLSGETNSTLSITNFEASDAGDYHVVITNDCGTVTSNDATLTMSEPENEADWYYGDADVYATLQAGTDNLVYQGNVAATSGAEVDLPYPVEAANNKWLVIRVPRGFDIYTQWFNNGGNQGAIPDSAFRDRLDPVGLPDYSYYCSRTAVSNDFPTNPLKLIP